MKKQLCVFSVAILFATSLAFAALGQDNVMRKQANGTYVVNTTSLAANVRGYKGATPLEVYIKNFGRRCNRCYFFFKSSKSQY